MCQVEQEFVYKLHEARQHRKRVANVNLVHPQREATAKKADGTKNYSLITDSLDGVFGFSSNEGHLSDGSNAVIDYSAMSRKPNQVIGKASTRRVNQDAFFDGEVDKREAMKGLLEVLAKKAYCRFRNVRDAFRLLDFDKSGFIDRDEMRDFFSQFNLSHAAADLFFDSMDPNGDGQLDYGEFMDRFGTVIQPGAKSVANVQDNEGENVNEGLHNIVFGPGWLRKLG